MQPASAYAQNRNSNSLLFLGAMKTWWSTKKVSIAARVSTSTEEKALVSAGRKGIFVALS